MNSLSIQNNCSTKIKIPSILILIQNKCSKKVLYYTIKFDFTSFWASFTSFWASFTSFWASFTSLKSNLKRGFVNQRTLFRPLPFLSCIIYSCFLTRILSVRSNILAVVITVWTNAQTNRYILTLILNLYFNLQQLKYTEPCFS